MENLASERVNAAHSVVSRPLGHFEIGHLIRIRSSIAGLFLQAGDRIHLAACRWVYSLIIETQTGRLHLCVAQAIKLKAVICCYSKMYRVALVSPRHYKKKCVLFTEGGRRGRIMEVCGD